MKRISPCLLLLVFSPILFLGQLAKDLTVQDWQEDFSYLKQSLEEKHIALYRHTDRDAFEEKFREIDRYLANSKPAELSTNRLISYVFEIVALIRDNHSFVSGRYSFLELLPFTSYWFGEDLRILSTSVEDQKVLGAKILFINGVGIQEVYQKFKAVVPHANEWGYKGNLPYYIRHPELLEGLGITSQTQEVEFELELENGEQEKYIFEPVSLEQYREKKWLHVYDSSIEVPLYAQNPKKNYWFTYLPDKRLLYLRYRRAANQKAEKIDLFWKRLFAFVDQSAIDKMLVDLRGNGGGQADLAFPLVIGIQQRAKINQRGKLFTLINRDTESAAISLATQLENRTETLFVGEGVGDRPHHLSDARYEKLPHSKISIGIPILYYQNTHEYDTRFNIEPHIPVFRTFEAHKNRIDPAWEAILAYEPSPRPDVQMKIPVDYLGRYAFSKDKTLRIFTQDDRLYAKLSNGWHTELEEGEELYQSKVKGLNFSFTEEHLVMHLPDGRIKRLPRREEEDVPPLELIQRKQYVAASKAYQNLREQEPKLIALHRNNLSAIALFMYLEHGDLEQAKALMKINRELHPGKGFVDISMGQLYQTSNKDFQAFFSFMKGFIKGYKD